jgi:AcrR family transcriptional regulator
MSTSKDLILDAAERIVLRDGPAHLTLDAVAAETPLSKGGLLYHFASKDDLIRGMISRRMDQFEAAIAQSTETDPDPAGRKTRALLSTFLNPGAGVRDRISATVLAAVANNPSLLEPMQERFRTFQAAIMDDGLDPVTAAVATLAANGLWFGELLNFPPFEPRMRDQIIARLRLLTQGI